MKSLKIAFIVAFVLTLCVFSGLVYGLEPNGLSAVPVFSKPAPAAGETITIRITVQSNSAEQLQITGVGINFDWMAAEGLQGVKLTSNPATIPPNGSYVTPPFQVQIPANTTMGIHNYFIGVDGLEGTAQTAFNWNSATANIQILPAGVITTTTTPAPTAAPTQNGGGTSTGGISNLEFYGAIAAVAVIVVVLLIVMLMRSKRKKAPVAAEQQAPAQQPGAPSKPDEFQI